MRISDWSSDVCSSDLPPRSRHRGRPRRCIYRCGSPRWRGAFEWGESCSWTYWMCRLDRIQSIRTADQQGGPSTIRGIVRARFDGPSHRSEEHTSELQSLMRISYAVFCLNKKKRKITHN